MRGGDAARAAEAPEFNRRVLRFLQEREAKAAEAGAAAE